MGNDTDTPGPRAPWPLPCRQPCQISQDEGGAGEEGETQEEEEMVAVKYRS